MPGPWRGCSGTGSGAKTPSKPEREGRARLRRRLTERLSALAETASPKALAGYIPPSQPLLGQFRPAEVPERPVLFDALPEGLPCGLVTVHGSSILLNRSNWCVHLLSLEAGKQR
jgi:hypothetical protein